ncbi:Citrate lyase subunit beta-like protein [Gordonia insulae]|uniref:Citrate lyase subunit beta-like protein n=1 Tax=Gordonia insulae TaxID=2420509 RepID=A0A3G8JJR9_9ACTN|nr:Citrate lyase subunit beta-like protein [Gordonia insulae]
MHLESHQLINAWTPPGPAMLFCPADRPERYQKALDRADVVILDLEDAVSPENRVTAREALIANPLDPDRTIVRINPAGTGDYRRDLAALGDTNYRVVMQAKAEDVDSIIDTALQTVALIETPLGATRAHEIAAAVNCIGLMWGAEDLVAGLGASRVGSGPTRSGPVPTVTSRAGCVRPRGSRPPPMASSRWTRSTSTSLTSPA